MSQTLQDTYLHKGLRKRLVQELEQKGITNKRVLEAINNIPRHFFLEKALERHAYEDKAFPILAEQTISQPYTVAYQTQLLDIQKFDKVLEVGTGSVYQASVLAEMGAMVYTIERQKEIYDFNQKYFPLKDKYRSIKFFFEDGYKGLPTYAPFDKIIVTAAAPFVPPALVEQLKPHGKLVIPVNRNENVQVMMRITKSTKGEIITEEFEDFVFVPMKTGKNEF